MMVMSHGLVWIGGLGVGVAGLVWLAPIFFSFLFFFSWRFEN